MLKLENLVWNTPMGTTIINNISLAVPHNRLLVITGPNGSGKTTLAKLIAGIETPLSGKIIMDDEDITDLDVSERAKKGLAFAFQQPVRFKGITVRDLLTIANKEASDAEIRETLLKVGLQPEKYLDREVDAKLSGGEIKRVEIASVLLRHAKYTIFDEPEAGIDIWSFKDLTETFESLKNDSDSALIIISHQKKVLSIADEIAVIDGGRVTDYGERAEMFKKIFCENDTYHSCCNRKGAIPDGI